MAFPQARLSDICIHPTVIVSGSPDTIVGGMPAARLGDLTTPCPLCKTPPPGPRFRRVQALVSLAHPIPDSLLTHPSRPPAS